jgi:hypothetical protein
VVCTFRSDPNPPLEAQSVAQCSLPQSLGLRIRNIHIFIIKQNLTLTLVRRITITLLSLDQLPFAPEFMARWRLAFSQQCCHRLFALDVCFLDRDPLFLGRFLLGRVTVSFTIPATLDIATISLLHSLFPLCQSGVLRVALSLTTQCVFEKIIEVIILIGHCVGAMQTA